MASLQTVAIWDKSGKLVGTYQTSTRSAGKDVPSEILSKFYTSTEVGPNGPLGYLKSGYSMESITEPDESNFYKNETTAYNQAAQEYQRNYANLQKQAEERRLEEAARIEQSIKQREASAAEVAAKNRVLAHTTGNPFVNPGAREISRRKAKAAIDSFHSSQFAVGDAIDSYNLLTFTGAFDTHNKEVALAKYNADHGLNTYGGYDNKYNDFSTAKLFQTSEQPVKSEAQINQEKYNALRPAYQDSRTGLQITGLENIPNKVSRQEAQQINKSLISAQLPAIIDKRILSQIPVERRNIKREQINKFLSSPQVENSIIPSAYAETQTTQRVSFGSGGIDRIKYAVAKAKVVGPVTLSYVDADKKTHSVSVKNANEAVRKIYNETKNGSKEFSISATSQPVQGPVQQFEAPNNEVGFGIAGSLTSVFGKEPQQQGPNLNDKAFFVGANAQGYTIETERPKPPIQTGISLIDNPRGLPEQIAEGSTRFFTNLASASSDFGIALQNNDFVSPKPFTDPNNPFGLPVPRKQTPTKPTAESELFEGKIPNLLDPGIAGSAVTSVGLLALGLKAPKAVSSAKNTVQGKINEAKVTKILSGLEAPQVLQSGKVVKGPSFPNSGEFTKETYQNTKYGNANYLEKGTVTAKAVKGRPDLVKLDSNNPLQDKSVYAIVEKGKVTTIKSFEPETAGRAPTHAKIRTNPNDVFGIESSKFDLIKTEKGIYETRNKIDAKSPILEATKSSAVQPVARARTFDVNDVLLNSKDFGRYFFQESGSNIPPARPITDTLLAETKSFGTVGTKIKTYPKSPLNIPPRTRPRNTSIEDPFGKPETITTKKTITNQKRIDELEKLEKSKRVLDEQKERMLKPLLDEMEGLVKLKQRGVKNTNSGSVNTRIELLDEEIQRTRDIFKPAYDNYKSELTRIKNTNPDKIIEETILQPKIKSNTRQIKPKSEIENIFSESDLIRLKIPTQGKDVYSSNFFESVFKPFKTIKGSITEHIPVTGRNTFFTKPNTLKYSRNKPLDTFVTDVQKNTKFIDPFADLTKGKGSKIKDIYEMLGIKKKPEPFNKGYEKTDGPQVIEKTFSKENIQSQIAKEARPKAREQDILFSAPRFLTSQYHGEITDSVLAFPQGTPEKFKRQTRIDTGLELNYKLKTGQSGEGDYFNRFGLEMFRQTKKDFEKQSEIPINIQARKPDQRIRVTPIQGIGLTPIQTPRTGITTKQTPGLKTDLITDLTTTTITTTVPVEVPPITGKPFEFGGAGIAFPGFGGSRGNRNPKKKYKKKYIVSSIDPLTPGSIETAGVEQQRVSSSKKIYSSLDVSLGKARKRNQPKGKRSRHSIPDPF